MRSTIRSLMLVGLISFGATIWAQDKQLTVRDAVSPAFIPQQLRQLEWRGDSERFAWVDYGTMTVMTQAVEGEPEELLGLDELNEALELLESTPLRYIPALNWESENRFSFTHNDHLYVYDLSKGDLREVNQHEADAEFLEVAANGAMAYVIDHNLHVSPVKDEPRAVTTDGNRELVYGEAAHRFEFGIGKGIFWSPSGLQVAFYRMDQRPVSDYPLINFMERTANHTPIKYPMAGDSSHHATVGVYDVETEKIIYLNTEGDPEQYLTNVTWGPAGKRIYVAVVNRDQNEMKLQVFDSETGALLNTLFTETHPKYVEPEHGPIFLPKNQDKFLWFSERDGFDHLYLYNVNGELEKQLTRGEWEVTEVLGIDPRERNVYFVSTAVSPLERHAYRVSLKSGKIERLTQTPGVHRLTLDGNANYLLDAYANRQVPNVVRILRATNGEPVGAPILVAPNPLAEYAMPRTELVTLSAEDGTPLYGRLITPPGLDSSRKYPVLVYLYGGPHAQLVTENWLGGGQLFLQYMAQQGFVVWTIDNRGSAHRGLAFEQAVFRKLGTLEIEDQLQGVEYLKNLPFVDANRMGVYGWSYGGFMATSLMLRAPGTFRVGVAGGPVIDWKFYEIMYTERYMDTPEQNPEGYEKATLTGYVEALEGDLLIIHGMQDDIVVPQHTQVFVRETVKKNKLIDFLPYPTHPHNVRGWDRAHLLNKISTYFKQRLLED